MTAATLSLHNQLKSRSRAKPSQTLPKIRQSCRYTIHAASMYILQPAIYLYYTLQFRNYIHKLDPRPARACSCYPLLLPARRSSTTWVCNISVASAWADTTSTAHCCTCKPEQTMQCPLGQRHTHKLTVHGAFAIKTVTCQIHDPKA